MAIRAAITERGRRDRHRGFTKNGASLSLPIFVILPGTDSVAKRSVRQGWVVDADDENKQFLILFGKHKPEYQPAPTSEMPFTLTGGPAPGKTTTKTRPGQQRFRFQVLANYGCKCAVCTITHPNLMKAAHICGKAHNGSDDWRNGLPFCATHRDAFDAHLFRIEPETFSIQTMPGVSPSSIGITSKILATLHRQPHPYALSWRFAQTNRHWATQPRDQALLIFRPDVELFGRGLDGAGLVRRVDKTNNAAGVPRRRLIWQVGLRYCFFFVLVTLRLLTHYSSP
jgi:hypothetical protein